MFRFANLDHFNDAINFLFLNHSRLKVTDLQLDQCNEHLLFFVDSLGA